MKIIIKEKGQKAKIIHLPNLVIFSKLSAKYIGAKVDLDLNKKDLKALFDYLRLFARHNKGFCLLEVENKDNYIKISLWMFFKKMDDRQIQDRGDMVNVKRIIDGLAIPSGLDELLWTQRL